MLLEELERESMFLVPLDTRREWYRFHQLFRDLLRFRLRAEDPRAEARLLGQAATLASRNGARSATAVDYLLRARDWAGALRVILGPGSEVFERGEMATVIRWITDVPEDGPARATTTSTSCWERSKVSEGMAAGAEDTLRRVQRIRDPPGVNGPVPRLCSASLAQWRATAEPSLNGATCPRDARASSATPPSRTS